MVSSALSVSPPFLSEQVTNSHRFYRHWNPQTPARELTVICGGWEECSADYEIVRHSFPYFSLEFVAAGEGEVRLAGRRHALTPGTVFTYGPGISQEIRTSAVHRLRKYFVDFVGAESRRLLSKCHLAPGATLQLSISTEVRQAFDTLIRLADSEHPDSSRMCALQLEILLLYTVRGADAVTPAGRRALGTFERCRQKIDADFLTLHTVEEAAAVCHVDISYLCRLFHRFHGERPFRYLQRRQMEWAAQRLQDSGCLIREVADELGIDAFQFSRTFKRIHGVSPTTFLEAHR